MHMSVQVLNDVLHVPASYSHNRSLAYLPELTGKAPSIAALEQTYLPALQGPNTEESWMMVQTLHSPAVLTGSEGLAMAFPESLWLDPVRGSHGLAHYSDLLLFF